MHLTLILLIRPFTITLIPKDPVKLVSQTGHFIAPAVGSIRFSRHALQALCPQEREHGLFIRSWLKEKMQFDRRLKKNNQCNEPVSYTLGLADVKYRKHLEIQNACSLNTMNCQEERAGRM